MIAYYLIQKHKLLNNTITQYTQVWWLSFMHCTTITNSKICTVTTNLYILKFKWNDRAKN